MRAIDEAQVRAQLAEFMAEDRRRFRKSGEPNAEMFAAIHEALDAVRAELYVAMLREELRQDGEAEANWVPFITGMADIMAWCFATVFQDGDESDREAVHNCFAYNLAMQYRGYLGALDGG